MGSPVTISTFSLPFLTHCKFTTWLFTSIRKYMVLCMLSRYPFWNIHLILKIYLWPLVFIWTSLAYWSSFFIATVLKHAFPSEKLAYATCGVWKNWHRDTCKRNAQFLFLCNLQKLSVNVCLIKIIKKHRHKNSNCVFLYLGKENF